MSRRRGRCGSLHVIITCKHVNKIAKKQEMDCCHGNHGVKVRKIGLKLGSHPQRTQVEHDNVHWWNMIMSISVWNVLRHLKLFLMVPVLWDILQASVSECTKVDIHGHSTVTCHVCLLSVATFLWRWRSMWSDGHKDKILDTLREKKKKTLQIVFL